MVAGAAVWCSTQCPRIPSLCSAFQRGLVLARCGETGSVIYSSWEYKFGQLFAGQCSNICQIFKDIPSMVANSRPVNSLGATPGSELISVGLHISPEEGSSTIAFTAEEAAAQRIKCLAGGDGGKAPFFLRPHGCWLWRGQC